MRSKFEVRMSCKQGKTVKVTMSRSTGCYRPKPYATRCTFWRDFWRASSSFWRASSSGGCRVLPVTIWRLWRRTWRPARLWHTWSASGRLSSSPLRTGFLQCFDTVAGVLSPKWLRWCVQWDIVSLYRWRKYDFFFKTKTLLNASVTRAVHRDVVNISLGHRVCNKNIYYLTR